MELEEFVNKKAVAKWRVTEDNIERYVVHSGLLRLKPGKQFSYEIINSGKVACSFSFNDYMRKVVSLEHDSN